MTDPVENKDEWSGRTIVGVPFESPHKLTALCLDQSGPAGDKHGEIERKLFKIRMADTEGRRNSTSVLINRLYSWRGYDTGNKLEQQPNRITLVASVDNTPIGTITLNFDSPEGLPADEVYKDRLNELRTEGHLLCEPTNLAIDQNVRSKRVIATLFHMAYMYARNIMVYTDFVLEVNPRHALFYQRMLGSHIIGEERNCPRVNAPAVLLRLEIAHMTTQIAKFGGTPAHAASEKSLYPYFFSHKEENGITQRLLIGA